MTKKITGGPETGHGMMVTGQEVVEETGRKMSATEAEITAENDTVEIETAAEVGMMTLSTTTGIAGTAAR